MADDPQVRKFGLFELDLRSRELVRNGRRVRLQEQPFQILSALLEHPGEVLTREELRRRVWTANTFVDFDNGLNIAVAKLRQVLHDDAGNPRYIETLPRLGYRFVASVDEPAPLPEPAPAVAAVPKRQPDRLAISLVLSGVLMWGAIWTSFSRRPGISSQQPSIAVIARNTAGGAGCGRLCAQVAEMLSIELESSDRVRTIPGQNVADAKRDLALPDTDSFSAETLALIRRATGAAYVAVVSLGPPAGAVSMDVRLQDTASGETRGVIAQSDHADDLRGLVARAGDGLLRKLIPGFASQSAAGAPASALPADADSAQLYVEGLSRLRAFDAQGALELLQRALEKDPGLALAHAALAQAWDALGYAGKAKDESKEAWRLAAKLPHDEQLSFEAVYREFNGEWDKAIRAYAELLREHHGRTDYALRMARAQIRAGKAGEALGTVEKLRSLPPDAFAGAIDYVESLADEKLGKFDEAQRAAARAAQKAQDRHQVVLMADARAQECRQFIQRSQSREAAAACEIAIGAYKRVGDRSGLAASTGYLAAARFNQGDLDAARGLYTEALDIHRQIGNQAGMLWESNGLANVLLRLDDLSGALERYQESLKISRAIGSQPDEADALENTGVVWLMKGNVSKARDSFQEALARFREMGNQAGVGSVLDNLGGTLYLMGDLPEAATAFAQALETDRKIDYPMDQADVLIWLGRVQLARGQTDEARRDFAEGARIAGETGIEIFAAYCRLAMAESALESGHPEDAETVIRRELDFFERHKLPRQQLEAGTLLVRALLQEGKTDEARQVAERFAPIAQASQRPAVKFAFAIESARAKASVRDLDAVIAGAAKSHMAVYQIEARLAVGEVELKQGRTADARRVLDQLEKDARARGFEAVARKAAQLNH